jgi:urease accessory protein
MTLKPIYRPVLMLTSMVVAPLAAAHTGMQETGGLADGFMHPVTGFDHILVAIGAGFWMAGSGRHCVQCTVLFLLMFLAGILLGTLALALPDVGIQSVVVFLLTMLVIAVAIARQEMFGYAFFGGFALYHALVHIIEMPQPAALGGYALGLLLSTGVLLALGIILRQVLLACKPAHLPRL